MPGCAGQRAGRISHYPSGLSGHNYTITYVPGTLTVWDAAAPPDKYGWIKIFPPEGQSWYGSSPKPFPQTGSTAFSANSNLLAVSGKAEGTLDFGYTLTRPEAPTTKELTYIDAQGEVATVTGHLVGMEQTEGYGWREIDLRARWYGDEHKEGFYAGRHRRALHRERAHLGQLSNHDPRSPGDGPRPLADRGRLLGWRLDVRRGRSGNAPGSVQGAVLGRSVDSHLQC